MPQKASCKKKDIPETLVHWKSVSEMSFSMGYPFWNLMMRVMDLLRYP